jgi:hypothetical protein
LDVVGFWVGGRWLGLVPLLDEGVYYWEEGNYVENSGRAERELKGSEVTWGGVEVCEVKSWCEVDRGKQRQSKALK